MLCGRLASAQTVRSDDFNRPDGPLVVVGGMWGQQTTYGGGAVIRDTVSGDPLTGVVGGNTKLTIAFWQEDFGLAQFSQGVIAPGFDPGNGAQVFVNRRASGVPWRYGFMFVPTVTPTCASGACWHLKADGGTSAPVIADIEVGASQFSPGDTVCIDHQTFNGVGVLRGVLNGVVVISGLINPALGTDPLVNGNPGVAINPLAGSSPYVWDSWTGGSGLCAVN